METLEHIPYKIKIQQDKDTKIEPIILQDCMLELSTHGLDSYKKTIEELKEKGLGEVSDYMK